MCKRQAQIVGRGRARYREAPYDKTWSGVHLPCLNVAYAGQVLSRTVGLQLKEKNWPGTENLADFIFG